MIGLAIALAPVAVLLAIFMPEWADNEIYYHD